VCSGVHKSHMMSLCAFHTHRHNIQVFLYPCFSFLWEIPYSQYQRTCGLVDNVGLTFVSSSLATTVKTVRYDASFISCLTPTLSFLLIVLSSIIQLYWSAITRESTLSTKDLKDTKLTGNDRAYKTDDNVIDGVHVPTPLTG
jgi:hypothetical protein